MPLAYAESMRSIAAAAMHYYVLMTEGEEGRRESNAWMDIWYWFHSRIRGI
jgi:hypothetical protein